ncbi:ROK family transcriptional regulator [Tessaracoccus sp. ZS01]|uniref:ROK family transcriptional regulator n=1 Tax=Tessaracoccus sp. ZS01 TaxID=1906324 RepID=UPI00096DB81D|nr:ROK family transcriptional regulator [Tessaracoccus sp. ZS01]OMG57061.1 hypothetical protein BJN44_07690 [Tessaracoccus sp. ZS01]
MRESSGAPGSQASLREANSARILEAVKLYGQLTQVELAAATGLSPATVSNIVKQLLAAGTVETSATTRSGRRAQLVTLARVTSLALGIHIRPRALEMSLVDAGYTQVARQHLPLPPEHRFDTTLDRAAMLAAELADQRGLALADLVGIGVAMPSANRGGAVVGLPTWDDVDVADIIERRLHRPVLVERETDAAALAEARIGALRGAACGVYVRVGEVTDSTIVLGGAVLRPGSAPAAGLGHVRVAPDGAICRCGARGCLNTVVSIEALRELVRISHGPLSLRDMVAAANSGDRGCRQVVADAGAAIGAALADMATTVGPDRIAVGGPLAQAADVLLGPMLDALGARPLLADAGSLLVPGQLGQEAETLGVVARVFDMMSLTSVLETSSGGEQRG